MFDVHCERCGRVLLPASHIRTIDNTADGIRVEYRCWCGRVGAESVGRRERSRRVAA